MTKDHRIRFYVLLAVLLFVFAPAGALADDGSLTTLFDAYCHMPGILFDVEVIGEEDILIRSFDINLTGTPGATTVWVYYREGGIDGYEHTASAWTLAGSADVTAMGKNAVTHLPIGGIRLYAGKTYGIYMVGNTGTDMRYTDSPTSPPPVYQDENLKIYTGTAQGFPAFGGQLVPLRVWNGTVYYSTQIATMPETGDQTGQRLWIWALAAGLSLLGIGIGVYFVRKRKG